VGAFAMKVIASSSVPVIIVQNKGVHDEGYKKIILPIDHNRHGKNKTAYAISMAKYFDGEVHIFEARETDEYIANHVKLNLNHAKQYLAQNNIPFREVTEKAGEGSFIKQLLRYASEVSADMIVISSEHDKQGMADLILGKNEVQIINNDAQIAVMCVNPVQDTAHLGVFG
jgi:nucleotide-binding universal stress UspA family protein